MSATKTSPKPKAKAKKALPGKVRSRIEPDSLVLVHFIEKQLEGWTFERTHWPLHITLVAWFKTDDEEAVVRSLERLAGDTAPMTLLIGGQERFGGRKTANVIKNAAAARTLHQKLLTTLEGADIALHSSQFTRQEYRAHITRQIADGRHSNEGERVLLKDFHLVRLVDDKTCRVEQQFMLVG